MQTVIKAPSLSTGSLFLALTVAIVWGLNFVMVKIGLQQLPPLTLCALRFFFASIPAIFFLPKPNASWKYIIGYGLLTFALAFSLLFAGMSFGISPSIAALVIQSQVFFTVLITCVLGMQILTIWQATGGIISFAGIGVIALHHNPGFTLIGFLLLLASAFSSGMGNVISVKLKNVNMLSLVVWGSFVAFFPLAIAAFLFEQPLAIIIHPQQLTITTVLALTYITYVSTYFGYGCWSWLLSRYPTASVTSFALLCPVVAMFCASLFLGENFEPWKVSSAILVMLGVGINIFGSRFYRWLQLLPRLHRESA